MILGSAIINPTVGVPQGSPSSSFLSTTYIVCGPVSEEVSTVPQMAF